jgi:pectin methylesterase-like acyl-CoA thioesterase
LGFPGNGFARDYFVNPSGADGAFPTVQSAVDAVAGQTEIDRANIFIAPAKYVGRVSVDKPFVTFIGQGETPADVIISSNGTPTETPMQVFNETVAIPPSATAFMARNLTFENSTSISSSLKGLALRCDADRAIFDNVRCLGYQDTLLVWSQSRQYFRGSRIRGDVDFIFGNATAVFDRCTIESAPRGDQRGYITAADTTRTTANGLIFLDCDLVSSGAASNSVFLGRPWFYLPSEQMPSVIFIRARMGTHIAQAGWDPWDSLLPLSVNRDPYTRVSEWGSMNLSGQLLADSNDDGTPDGRVPWADSMTAEQAANYTLENIFGPVEFWNAATQPDTPGIFYASQGAPWSPNAQLLSVPAKPGAQPQLLNISTRLRVGGGQPVGIGGFIVTGTAPKKVILRAIGPSLSGSGLSNAVADPVLELHGGAQSQLMATNDNWKNDPAAAELESLGMMPADDREAATMLTLTPGHYTAVIAGKDGSAGTALVEMYDVDPVADSQFGNVSTLGFVGTGDDALVGGFVVGGPGLASVVVRAVGPSLTTFGVQNVIEDPTLAVHDSNGNVTVNDDWQSAANGELVPLALQPRDAREAAIQLSLAPGSYTAIVRGKGNATGVALVEAYNLP